MIAKSRIVALAALVLFVSLVSGCPQSPGSICQHMVNSIDAMYMRCGFNLQVRLSFDGGVTSTQCGHVSHISMPNQLVNQCIPWADNADCSTLEIDSLGHPVLDPSCDFGLLEGRP